MNSIKYCETMPLSLNEEFTNMIRFSENAKTGQYNNRDLRTWRQILKKESIPKREKKDKKKIQ
jgi:hypothetical protein